MAFITLGTATQLQIKVPTIGSTDWADTMRTDTFLKIAQHQHTGAGDGAQLGTGSLSADAVTGAKIRLDNDEYLKARNAADSANINIIKVDANDDLYMETEIANLLMKQDTYILGRNAADSANINLLKVNASDKIAIGADLANLAIITDTYIQGRNAADSGYINLLKVNASDKIAIGADVANLAIINDTYIQGRNNADSGYIDIAKVGTDDKIALGATVLAANVETVGTSLINTLDSAVTLTDNQSATSAGIVTLGTDESCAVHYRIVRNGAVQNGTLRFNDTDTVPSDMYHGTDNGVTFTVSAGALQYATTSTGFNGSMTYVVIKE